ncbi:MAG: hypothetical protein R3B70_16350 [Polyangiaceae bacterium]
MPSAPATSTSPPRHSPSSSAPPSPARKHKDISQPGQFACKQQVNLIGPRGRIDGVRVLGPSAPGARSRSRTDEFKLGVDAPIRDSGNVASSPHSP